MKSYIFHASVQQEEDGRWSAWIEALPGCTAWGYTKEEALAALKDAAELYVQDMIEAGQELPTRRDLEQGRYHLVCAHLGKPLVPYIGLWSRSTTGNHCGRGTAGNWPSRSLLLAGWEALSVFCPQQPARKARRIRGVSGLKTRAKAALLFSDRGGICAARLSALYARRHPDGPTV